MSKRIIRTFQFRSSSNPSQIWTTLLYDNGTASCNCPGWTRHTGEDGSRTCKHIIAAGIAPVSVTAPIERDVPTPGRAKKAKHGNPAKIAQEMRTVRRFNFDED